ncbi:MAGE-domain-containing protein [Teratosphaeria destructans]|uniref:MAGE-domain-containing protein n=1 Tax=Teratosphaeria destructans TaxID=418781 RepID=A0A9W7SUL3_9PEZI|nr:MAGE-domain-containing protein [Teratosphaeria destructans]
MPLVQDRKRRAQPDDDDDASAGASSPEPATQRRRTTHNDDDADISFGNDNGFTQADTNTDALVKKMVRLALACEYQRRPIRRTDISDKVLAGTTGRNKFRDVFNQAQIQLRAVFGMEMVELPAREKATLSLQQQRKLAAQKSQSQGQSQKGAGSWVLVSVLPRDMREGLVGALEGAQEEERIYVGFSTVLVALIALSGGSLPDTKMDQYVRRLGAEDTTPLAGTAYERTENLMKRLERDGYLLKIREPSGTGEDDVYWVVGPRGKVEVGDEGASGLVKTVYDVGNMGNEEGEELERRIERSLGMAEKLAAAEKEGMRLAQAGANKERERQTRGRRQRDDDEEEDEEEEEEEEEE